MKRLLTAAGGLVLAGCGPAGGEADLLDRLSSLCGRAFEGAVVSGDPRDDSMAGQRLVMHVRDCGAQAVRIPFHVGEDRSRTWVITRLEDGRLRLKHDHRHEDGSEDVLTWYGGETRAPVTGPSADFPADAESRALFEREGIEASMQNVWTIALQDGDFVYALNRPGRTFEARFDLSEPVAAPPPPWGAD